MLRYPGRSCSLSRGDAEPRGALEWPVQPLPAVLGGPGALQPSTGNCSGEHLSVLKSVPARSDLPFGFLAPGDEKEASIFSNSPYEVC